MSQAEIEMSQAAVEPSTNAFSGVVDLLLESRIKLDPLENVLKETERNMKSITIYVLLIGLIWPFTQAARGQESGSVQPPPAKMVEESQRSAGGTSEFDVGKRSHAQNW